MKLLYCLNCKDIYNLTSVLKKCRCGETMGKYTDNLNAWYSGRAMPLGFANSSFIEAIRNQPEESPGKIFDAFVIERNCKTFKEKK